MTLTCPSTHKQQRAPPFPALKIDVFVVKILTPDTPTLHCISSHVQSFEFWTGASLSLRYHFHFLVNYPRKYRHHVGGDRLVLPCSFSSSIEHCAQCLPFLACFCWSPCCCWSWCCICVTYKTAHAATPPPPKYTTNAHHAIQSRCPCLKGLDEAQRDSRTTRGRLELRLRHGLVTNN